MSAIPCPFCSMDEVLTFPGRHECLTCGHEWALDKKTSDAPSAGRIVKDAHGTVLLNGDIVAMVADLKLKGTSETLKIGTKSKPIRLVDGDHEIDCRMNGLSIALKACYVKKVTR
ncbi:alkylphosphonate utilization protein [Akkermansiaceae bacterium]|nr:alkylphosphonate utilization protein [Akkermansiaceae bacterium]